MSAPNAINWQQATAAVDAAERILIVTHVSPDGDAIGSMLGLANALRQRGKDVTTAVDDGVPDFLSFLPGADAVLTSVGDDRFDLLISTDASDASRSGQVGEAGRQTAKTVINLDHHVTNDRFGDLHLIDGDACSAAEVAYRWLRAMNAPFTPEIAVPLLTGLVTDTLGFRTNSTRPATLQIAQDLMQAGASLTEITARCLETQNEREFKLWQRVLPTAELDGQVLVASISYADFAACGVDDLSDAGLVGFLVRVEEAMISVIFKETEAGEVKVSMRAKNGYDVSEVALSLGGGGHKVAAGATIPGPLADARARVMPLLHVATAKGELQIG